MAILSRVSQRALWLRRMHISSMPVSTSAGAEVPGKPRKHHGVAIILKAVDSPTTEIVQRPSTTTIKHLLCTAVNDSVQLGNVTAMT